MVLKEGSGMMAHEKWMALALDQARTAYDQGEFPVGCVIVQGQSVVAEGARKGTAEGVPVFSEVDHAEMRALKQLESRATDVVPAECTLYCTMEPCLMCFGAILLSGIRTIVYAYEDAMGGGAGIDLSALTPLYRDAEIRIVPGVLRQKSLDLFYNFFNKETNLYWKDSFLEAYTRDQIK